MSEQIAARQRRREFLITLSYTFFSVFMTLITTAEDWPIWYIPLISAEIAFVWWSYISKFHSYLARVFIVTTCICLNILLYGIQGENFFVLIPTLCVEFLLLSLYELTQIINITIIQTVLLLIYHLIVNTDEMLPNTQLEMHRYTLQTLSLVVLIALCIYRIRHHEQEEIDFVKLERRVEMEQKIKDDFMANTSHELRTPINTISGMCEILLQKKLSEDVHSSVLDIQMTGVELQDIVTDIMDYSALSADTMELSPRAYSITSTLNDVMNMTVFENREKQLEIIFDCNPNIPRLLEGDEQQLRRILNNLISNAIKFTSEGGVVVRVSYRREKYGINLIVTVSDTGVGIGLEEQEIILRGFYQSDSDRNRKSSGIGLGLTISSALVKKMGGFLTIKSQKGKGSEFSFSVPQKVLDDQPCISLLRPTSIKLLWYYRSNSNVATVKDSFVEHIKHFSDYFGIMSQQISSIEECKRRVSQGDGIHLIIGWNEYMEDKSYFDSLAKTTPTILITDRSDDLDVASDIHVLYKPYNAMMLAEIINGREISVPARKKTGKAFTAPTAKILAVDDNLMNLKVVEGLLRKYKIKIVAASSGEEALTLIDSQDYDFVFMDHMMPGMDGVECFHRIREKSGSYFEKVPIIALTANAIAGSKEMFLSEGFNDFIAKPVDSALLNEILQRYIPIEKQIYDDEVVVSEPVKTAEKTVEKTHKTEAGEIKGYEKIRDEETIEAEGSEASAEISGPVETGGTVSMEIFDDLPLIDKDTALMYCDNAEDFCELAEVYCNSGEKYVADLKSAFDDMDIEKYRLVSHTIKSTSRTLGAVDLSEMALSMEKAATDKKEEDIKASHEKFIAKYEEVLKQLDRALNDGAETIDEGKSSSSSGEIDDWTSLKEEMMSCLESFETRSFEECIEKVKGHTLDGKPIEDVMSGVLQKASNFDFEGAIAELEDIGGNA